MKPPKPANDKNDKKDQEYPSKPPHPTVPSRPLRPLSPSQQSSAAPAGFIPPHGGYQSLLAYQKALVVFDATLYFCDRFIDKKSRTHDQMVQAARSGKQNILEVSEASGTSKEA